VLVYTRIPNETPPEAFLVDTQGATVADLLDQVRRSRSTKGREVALMIEGAVDSARLSDLGIVEGDLLEIAVSGSPRPLPEPVGVGEDIDFSSLMVEPVKGAKRLSEYEEVTQLLQWAAPYHIDGGRPSQKVWTSESTLLNSSDWEAYRSPDKLYYRTYVGRQAKAERAVSTAFRYAEESGQLASAEPSHVAEMRELVSALQYPDWGLCMLHQHVTRFAMSSWIAGATQFMMFDELRHAQLYGRLAIAYGDHHEGFGDPHQSWMGAPRFQPARKLIEEILAVLDWGQSLVIAGLVIEPLLTGVFHSLIAARSGRDGDSLTPFVCASIAEDKVRHRESVMAFIDGLANDSAHGEANTRLILSWVERWLPQATEAATVLAAGNPTATASIATTREWISSQLASVTSAVAESA